MKREEKEGRIQRDIITKEGSFTLIRRRGERTGVRKERERREVRGGEVCRSTQGE